MSLHTVPIWCSSRDKPLPISEFSKIFLKYTFLVIINLLHVYSIISFLPVGGIVKIKIASQFALGIDTNLFLCRLFGVKNEYDIILYYNIIYTVVAILL